jgi:serine/threonine protein kinase
MPGTKMTNRAPEPRWSTPGPGDVIGGKYVIEGPCGRGGLAVVYSAMQLELDRRVAIKMLLPEWAGDGEVVERFLREGRASTRIHSEHVVRVFDVGTMESGAPYLVLEFLQGQNLEDVVTHWGPIAVPTAVDWVLQASEAIAEAHAVGVVHRDLKPANLFLTQRADGSSCVKVIDFGLSKLLEPTMTGAGAAAKITTASEVMGSPHYMAPEQLRATRDADARVDLWALGTVLHELITGLPPFVGHTVPEIYAAVLTQSPAAITSTRGPVPRGLQQAILRLLEKDPAARYANVAEMAHAIAPFGTPAARTSCERIARVSVARAPVRNETPTPPPPRSDFRSTQRAPWPPKDDRMLSATEPRAPTRPQAATEPRAVTEPRAATEPRAPTKPRAATDLRVHQPTRSPMAPARVLIGALLMLAGVFAGVFMLLYKSVHEGDAGRLGVTALQGTDSAQAAPPPAGPGPGATPSPRPATPKTAPVVTLTAAPPAVSSPAAHRPNPAPAADRPRPHASEGVRPSDRAVPAPAATPVAALPAQPSTAPQTDPPVPDTSAKPPSEEDLFDGRK